MRPHYFICPTIFYTKYDDISNIVLLQTQFCLGMFDFISYIQIYMLTIYHLSYHYLGRTMISGFVHIIFISLFMLFYHVALYYFPLNTNLIDLIVIIYAYVYSLTLCKIEILIYSVIFVVQVTYFLVRVYKVRMKVYSIHMH